MGTQSFIQHTFANTLHNVASFHATANGTLVDIMCSVATDADGNTIGPDVWTVTWTPTLHTSANANNGLVIAATEVLSGLTRGPGKPAYLKKATLLDKGYHPCGVDMWMLKANVVLGTEGAYISISDSNAENVIDVIQFNTAEGKDLKGSYWYPKRDLSIPITPATDSTSIYVGLACTDYPGLTPITFGASDFFITLTLSNLP